MPLSLLVSVGPCIYSSFKNSRYYTTCEIAMQLSWGVLLLERMI
jgi:hypothetical protein